MDRSAVYLLFAMRLGWTFRQTSAMTPGQQIACFTALQGKSSDSEEGGFIHPKTGRPVVRFSSVEEAKAFMATLRQGA